MTSLDTLKTYFHNEVPLRPEAQFAHIITLRVAESFPIFRTDGDLNTARVSAGRVKRQETLDRVAMFMRKQTTAERLRGRELLRGLKLIPEECRYNENPCGRCADCVTYGYAIGSTGAEKSKVFSDTAYSLTDIQISTERNTFNAPGETGTMYDQQKSETSNRINSTEYVKPGVIFPSVLSLRDLTFPLFCYALNNHLSTERYGATTTRTGRMDNIVIGIVIADGEIMSNLALTQAMYDQLQKNDVWDTSTLPALNAVQNAATTAMNQLIDDAHVRVNALITENDLTAFLAEFRESVSKNPEDCFRSASESAEEYFARLRTKENAPKKSTKGGK